MKAGFTVSKCKLGQPCSTGFPLTQSRVEASTKSGAETTLKILIMDLAPGRWVAVRDGRSAGRPVGQSIQTRLHLHLIRPVINDTTVIHPSPWRDNHGPRPRAGR